MLKDIKIERLWKSLYVWKILQRQILFSTSIRVQLRQPGITYPKANGRKPPDRPIYVSNKYVFAVKKSLKKYMRFELFAVLYC